MGIEVLMLPNCCAPNHLYRNSDNKMTTLPCKSIGLGMAGLLFLSGCNLPGFSAKKDFESTIPVNSQVEVIAETFNGSIDVTPTENSEIELIAHIKAYGNSQEEADKALELLIPEVDTSTDAVTIRCKKRSNSIFSSDQVRLELKVPAKWPLRLTTSNGHIKTSNSQSTVNAQTSNGSIDVVDAQGDIHLSTSNGRIEIKKASGNIQANTSNGAITLANCNLTGDCTLGTSNGSIGVVLNQIEGLKFEASTSNGSIRCDEEKFEFSKKSKTRVEGTWKGESGASSGTKSSLVLSTSNGSITIKSETAELSKQAPSEPEAPSESETPATSGAL